ncbi:MAG: tetratricopeptide repeat protein [Oscillochloris sp.]|nr:tetratricopeptide repeat protein [Oscillochloris sp.]
MNRAIDSYLPPLPQTGRQPAPGDSTPPSLLQRLRAAVERVTGDIFINDSDPLVSELGQLARTRHPRQADDYFALGDLCAQRTLNGMDLNRGYGEKAMIAYSRAGDCSSSDAAFARRSILAFGFWTVDVARMIGDAQVLETAAAICEMALRSPSLDGANSAAGQLREAIDSLRIQVSRIYDPEPERLSEEAERRQRSRKLTDQGQAMLRTQQMSEALNLFDRAIEADEANATAWLWRALALTDVARFDDALQSYDKAIELDATSYGAWNAKGTLLMELGKPAKALECFERALEMPLPPPIVKAAFLLSKGKALYALGRYEEARDALVRSDQLDSTPESVAGIAACHEMLGRDA